MQLVDICHARPYILLVILITMALEPILTRCFSTTLLSLDIIAHGLRHASVPPSQPPLTLKHVRIRPCSFVD